MQGSDSDGPLGGIDCLEGALHNRSLGQDEFDGFLVLGQLQEDQRPGRQVCQFGLAQGRSPQAAGHVDAHLGVLRQREGLVRGFFPAIADSDGDGALGSVRGLEDAMDFQRVGTPGVPLTLASLSPDSFGRGLGAWASKGRTSSPVPVTVRASTRTMAMVIFTLVRNMACNTPSVQRRREPRQGPSPRVPPRRESRL